MHQAIDLKIILLHILHLILNFECIIFEKMQETTMLSRMSFKKILNPIQTSLMLVPQA
jgi:hypothetical protein